MSNRVPLIACARCGHITARMSSDQKYCPACEEIITRKPSAETIVRAMTNLRGTPVYTVPQVVGMARAEGKSYGEKSAELEPALAVNAAPTSSPEPYQVCSRCGRPEHRAKGLCKSCYDTLLRRAKREREKEKDRKD